MPWLLGVLHFRNLLSIGGIQIAPTFYVFDNLANRPLPSASRTLVFGIIPATDLHAMTPYLDAQINIPLLLLLACVLIFLIIRPSHDGHERPSIILAGVFICLAAFTLALSVSQELWVMLPALRPLTLFQFSYRLITYVNLFLMIATVMVLMSHREVGTHAREPSATSRSLPYFWRP